jgi:hypothetical protein
MGMNESTNQLDNMCSSNHSKSLKRQEIMEKGFKFFLLVILGFEFRALCLLGRCRTTSDMPLPPFSEVIFQIESCVLQAQAGLYHDSLIYAFCVIGMTGVYHFAHPLLRWMSHKLFAWANLEP